MSEGVSVVVLDGDKVRQANNDRDFTDEGRRRHLEKISKAAQVFEETGKVCIVAAVSPRREWRDMMRAMWCESRLVYLPGGSLWPGTTYERPEDDEY